MNIRVLDLFSGIGGFSLGLERTGMRTVAFCERDEKCRQILRKHWADVPIHEDIRKLDAKPYSGTIDIICGGDPCQRNSNAWRHGTGEASPAGHFLRVIAECRPGIIIRENPATIRKDAPWPWWKFRRSLERLGYAVLPVKLRSCCVGGSSRRERLFLLAALSDANGKGLQGDVGEKLARAIKRGQNPNPARSDRRHPAPRVLRGGSRLPGRVDRIRQLGNSVDPRVAQFIGNLIMEYLKK